MKNKRMFVNKLVLLHASAAYWVIRPVSHRQLNKGSHTTILFEFTVKTAKNWKLYLQVGMLHLSEKPTTTH